MSPISPSFFHAGPRKLTTLYCLIEDLGRLFIFEKKIHRVALIRSGQLLIFYIFAFSYVVTVMSLLSKGSLIRSGC